MQFDGLSLIHTHLTGSSNLRTHENWGKFRRFVGEIAVESH